MFLGREGWSMARSKAAMDGICPNWEDVVNWIMPMSSKRSAISIIARLVLGATAYFIWQERNLYLFKNQSRTISQVHDVIVHYVRLQLLMFSFKNTWKVRQILAFWNVTGKFADEASYITWCYLARIFSSNIFTGVRNPFTPPKKKKNKENKLKCFVMNRKSLRLSELCTILPVTKMIEQGRNLVNTRVQTDGQSDETSDSILGQKDASIDKLMKINAPSGGTSSSGVEIAAKKRCSTVVETDKRNSSNI
nr:hypothetical protein [Tanacetum cinerariifolium]